MLFGFGMSAGHEGARMASETGNVLGRIEPQPPPGIKYMLGDESWITDPALRSPRRLHCEEWGNLGPMEMNPDITPNAAGFRVRTSERLAPAGARGFTKIDGVYFWTDRDYLDPPVTPVSPETPAERRLRDAAIVMRDIRNDGSRSVCADAIDMGREALALLRSFVVADDAKSLTVLVSEIAKARALLARAGEES